MITKTGVIFTTKSIKADASLSELKGTIKMADPRVALVTGFTGQDGTFLTRYLLDQGYLVVGLVRRISTEPPLRVRGKFDFSAELSDGRLQIAEADLESVSSLIRVIGIHQPAEVYNLAAQSHVGLSFGQPESTINANLFGVINLITALEAAHKGKWRMYQASTSEMFGGGSRVDKIVLDSGLKYDLKFNELSDLNPVSPYAIAKTAAHYYCQMKRDQGHFIACGILFNHESEIRGGDFVTQKIVRAVAQGMPLLLGNLEAKRDWGYAGDYVRAMHAMLQRDKPDDFVIGTGETHTVREFVEAAFAAVDKELRWRGEGVDEIGFIHDPSRPEVSIDPAFLRPNDVGYLRADPAKANKLLGWWPEVKFTELVKLMVKAQKK